MFVVSTQSVPGQSIPQFHNALANDAFGNFAAQYLQDSADCPTFPGISDGAGNTPDAYPEAVAGVPASRSDSSWIEAATARSRDSFSWKWWAHQSRSNPDSNVTRT